MEGSPDAAQPIMEGQPGDEMDAGASEQVPIAAPEQQIQQPQPMQQ